MSVKKRDTQCVSRFLWKCTCFDTALPAAALTPGPEPAEQIAVGCEEIPCPAEKPRRQAGIRAKQGISELSCVAQKDAVHSRYLRFPRPRAQRSGSGPKAKKFPPERSFRHKAETERLWKFLSCTNALNILFSPPRPPPNREPSGADRGWKRRNSLSG